MSIGRVQPTTDGTKAECSTCFWEFETGKAGDAAKSLMEHNIEEHTTEEESNE